MLSVIQQIPDVALPPVVFPESVSFIQIGVFSVLGTEKLWGKRIFNSLNKIYYCHKLNIHTDAKHC